MPAKRKYSLQVKLVAAFSLISLLVAVFVVVVLNAHLQAAGRAAILEAEHVASAVAITGVEDAANNSQFLARYVENLHRFYKRDLSVLDLEKRVVADADPKKIGSSFTGDRGNEVALTLKDGRTRTFAEIDVSSSTPQKQVVVPMRQDEADKNSPITGAIIFEYTQIHEQLTQEARSRLYPLALIGLLFVLVTAVAGIRFAVAISKPVKELREGVVKLAKEFDVSVDMAGADEVEALAGAFKSMAERLRSSHNKLIDEHHDLETRVAARTTELTESNILLQSEMKERRRAQERLAFLARYDTLTKLPNRHMFHDRLAEALKAAKTDGALLACMVIDFDRLKGVNEMHGHGAGDLLLSQFGDRLRQRVRETDLVARLGSDEFGVMLTNLTAREDAGAVARKIIESLAEPFDLQGHETRTTVSVGIAVHPSDGADAEALLSHANIAMTEGKRAGANGYRYYDAAMNEARTQRAALESSLRGALERQELSLVYQPKAELTGGSISGLEALLRWSTPEHGVVPPETFVPMLEDMGSMTLVGDWVLHTVCSQVAAWRTQGLTPVPVAINVSMSQFREPDFDARVARIIEATGAPPAMVSFEIAESMLMRDPDRAAATLSRLREIGVKVTVDGFGAGYSSLSTLKRFPIDQLKIDAEFTQNMAADLNNAAIVLTIIGLAHNLKLTVVADGVETEAQAMYVRAQGCDELQGPYFAAPATAEECARMLREGKRLTWSAEDGAADAPRLLLIDDSEQDLELMRHALEPGGYRISVADNARAGLEMLMQRPRDIVISDHNMPGMSGVDFLTAVRSLFPKTVRIVMSGVDSAANVADALNVAGAHKFLSKNWDQGRLQAEVRDAYTRFHRGAPTNAA